MTALPWLAAFLASQLSLPADPQPPPDNIDAALLDVERDGSYVVDPLDGEMKAERRQLPVPVPDNYLCRFLPGEWPRRRPRRGQIERLQDRSRTHAQVPSIPSLA